MLLCLSSWVLLHLSLVSGTHVKEAQKSILRSIVLGKEIQKRSYHTNYKEHYLIFRVLDVFHVLSICKECICKPIEAKAGISQ